MSFYEQLRILSAAVSRKASAACRAAASVGSIALATAALPAALAQPVLYGGLGGHGVPSGPQASTNDGSLVIVSQTDGSTTVVGHPAGVARMSGIAFGLDGALYGATQVGGGYPPPPGPNAPSELIRIDPDTGALLSSVTISELGRTGLSIADLAVHPTTARCTECVARTIAAGERASCTPSTRPPVLPRSSATPSNSSRASPLHRTARCTWGQPTSAPARSTRR